MDQVLKSRSIQQLEAGYVADNNTDQLLSSNLEVDEFAKKVAEVMIENGFYLAYSSVSWGLQPLTGHTQNMSYKVPTNEHISCSVAISKKAFSATFIEYETKLRSDQFPTTNKDMARIEKAAAALSSLAKAKFQGRSVRVSVFER